MGMRDVARVLALVGVVLACVWGVVGTALTSSSVADAAFAVSENGTIHVSGNLPGAGFSIQGPPNYNGSVPGDGDVEFSDVPPGSYRITWQDEVGYSTPSSETKTLPETGGSISFHGEYTEIAQTGTIVVTANVPGATFNITGAATYSGAPRTISDAPAGTYTISWNDVPGYNTPGPQSRTLNANGTIEFGGQYTEIPVLEGTISVNSIPAGATFNITGAATYSGTAPWSTSGAPLGSYTITWNPLLGYNTPPSETRSLSMGGGISFTGNYAAVPQTGTIVVTANMPGATFTITGAAEYNGAPRTITDAPAGDYTITWRVLAGMTSPPPQTLTLLAGSTITFNGVYIDNIPPAISGVAVKGVTTTTATITWTTNEQSDSQVEYGLTIAFGFTTPVNPSLVTSHSVTITGMNPGTYYYYRVTSRDLAGNPMQSGRFEFLTSDDVPPKFLESSVIVTDISPSGATVKWETDERSDSQVEYGLTANYGSVSTIDSSLVRSHTVALTGLAPQTTYHYRVKSTDYWGNSSASPDATFTTIDVDAPVISGVAATGITDTSVIIVWFTDAPADSSLEYGLTTNYGFVSAYDNTMVTAHSVAISDLMAQNTYHYKVKSRDASGLWSETPDYTFTTGVDMGSDPPQILFLTPGEPTSSGTTISWSTNEMAISHVEYGLTEKDGKYDFSTAPSTEYKTLHVVPITGLKSGMTYHYRVVSTDAAGNRTVSGDKTFNTPMGRAPLPSLPAWAWAIVGVAGALLVGVLVVKNR